MMKAFSFSRRFPVFFCRIIWLLFFLALSPKGACQVSGKGLVISEHDRLITLAMERETLSDSLSQVIMAGKQELAREREVEKRRNLQQMIDSLELQHIRCRQQADALFQQAYRLEQEALFQPEDFSAGYAPNLSTGSLQDTARFPEYTSNLFYREDPFRKLFRRNELDRLDEWAALEQTGNEYISKAREAERKAAEWRVRADGARNESQMRRFQNRAGKEDAKALEYKMMAVEVYQVVNENKYLLFNDVLERVRGTVRREEVTSRIALFCERAGEQYAHAQTLRQAAMEQMNQEQKYQGLMEANAYELVTLENQKRAFETAAGIRRPDSGSVILITGASADSRRTFPRKEERAGVSKETQDARPVAAWPEGRDAETDTQSRKISEMGGKETHAGQRVEIQAEAEGSEEHVATVEKTAVSARCNGALGLEYKIQVGVFSSPLSGDYFQGYTPVTRETVPGTELIRYYVGKYGSYDEAQQALGRVRKNLSDQAFLVATLNGNRIALPRARSLEGREQTAREGASAGSVKERTEGAIPVFKVQVGAFRGTLPSAAENHYREASGGAQVEKRTDEQGLTVYTIGNFYTFDEAVRFRNRLVANGLTDAFVTAYLEGRRIGVEQARSMTNE